MAAFHCLSLLSFSSHVFAEMCKCPRLNSVVSTVVGANSMRLRVIRDGLIKH